MVFQKYFNYIWILDVITFCGDTMFLSYIFCISCRSSPLLDLCATSFLFRSEIIKLFLNLIASTSSQKKHRACLCKLMVMSIRNSERSSKQN